MGFLRSDVASFSPLHLFKGSEIGGWWDASDRTTMFQDVLFATPVTADAQVVLGWKDKSGRGNDVIEAVNGPAYKADQGGCLRFDGTNDILFKTSSLGGMYGQKGCSTFAALKCTAAIDDRLWSEGSSSTTTPVYAPVACGSTTASTLTGLIRNDASTTRLASAQLQMTNAFTGNTEVICNIQDHQTSTYENFQGGRVADRIAWQAAHLGDALTVDRFAIGALLRTSATNFMAMDLYELVVIGRVVTASERRAVMRYMGRPRGVYF